MNIKNQPLPKEEYFNEACKKTQIVLHHTVSSKNKGFNVINSFIDKGKSKIAVPYIIDADGTIYKLFEPQYWAYHLGIPKIDNVPLCKKSIAIELVNEGPLVKRDGKFYWFDGKYEYKGEVVEKPEWRGFKYFANYPQAQVEALTELVKELMKEFNIPKDVVTTHDYNLKYINNAIISHCNVRADKTDVSPAFDLEKFKEMI